MRRFTVRVEDLSGREDLIEFDRPNNEDFELKSKDLAAFSSKGGKLHVVQNLTVGRYMKLVLPPVTGCGGGGAIGAVLFLLLLGFCGILLSDNDPSDAPTPTSLYTGAVAPVIDPVAQEVSSTDLLYIHGDLNVRNAPNQNAALVRTLHRGELVRLGPKDENGWASIYDSSGNKEGYVYRASDLVRSAAPALTETRSAQTSPSTSRRNSGSSSSGYYTGPRGGCYTYSASGRKRYVDRSYCN